jgi:hypothetical protein
MAFFSPLLSGNAKMEKKFAQFDETRGQIIDHIRGLDSLSRFTPLKSPLCFGLGL